jgi:hypothetical protein
MSKKQQKPPQKVTAKPSPKKASTSQELSDDQLERVSGGATGDMFLKLDGIKGESNSLKLDVSASTLPAVQKTYKLF